ncbi:MAG: histone deacetylase family protein [Candidatus Bathyarchaeia archaeon]|jgi:acetoin utilization deacetylase AcuC-like enzyme
MKIVFHEKYFDVYSGDPASAKGRLDGPYRVLKEEFEFVRPTAASEADLQLVHTVDHIERIRRDAQLYEIATLAVGGAILASEIAIKEDVAFGLIRPPGHHASPNSCWGFCFFNNIAIAIKKLLGSGHAGRVLIIDFDLHFGDGTDNTFRGEPSVVYYHMGSRVEDLFTYLGGLGDFDIVAVSAGFDMGIADWGGSLRDSDYQEIGALLKEFARSHCGGRRFAVLEGGYNHHTLGKTIEAFLKAFN